ncbi:hypothetical protein KCU65_g6511, partial [Aureobasidium melanogenum]
MDLQLDDDVAPGSPADVIVLPPRRTASDPLEHNLSVESAFEPVNGPPELAVAALRRAAGFETLLLSQKHVLESIQFEKGRRSDHHKVLVSRFAAGKTTLLCLAGFVAVMRRPNDDSQPPTLERPGAEISHAAPPSEDSYNTSHSSTAAKPSVLMVVPFPENARDAGALLDQLLECHGSSCATVTGDVLAEVDLTALRKWPTAVIGTFERLLDLIELGLMDPSGLLYLAIDDLDVFLQNESFNQFLQALHERLPECQVVVTSSSMTQDLVAPVLKLIKPSSPIPDIVRMGRIPDPTTFEEVWHRLSAVEFDELPRWLVEHGLPHGYLKGKILMLVETSDGVENIYSSFNDYLKIHGCNDIDKYIRFTHHHQTEAERRTTLEQFRKDDFCMLVTTYKLARAIHIPDVDTAINIHPSKDLNVYRKVCTRIGREGKALICTLYGEEDMESIKQYKRVFNSHNTSLVIDGEAVSSNGIPEMTCLELLKEFKSAREVQ